jgi:hypothetical protein
MRLVVTDYVDDEQGFADAVEAWRRAMDLVAADGHLPEETRRKRDGMQYTQEALTYRVASADLAAGRGVDLWGYRGRHGVTLKDAVDVLARYWHAPDAWPWHDRVKVPTPGPMWEIAFAHWGDCAYAPMIRRRRPFGDSGNAAIRWTTLTHGRPLDPCG